MTIDLLAPAKINLGLEVIRRRDDGYHDIATVFQTISIFDRIRIREARENAVHFIDRADQLEQNLAASALDLAREAGIAQSNYRIEIDKLIPIAAGLGGASADAAAVLRGLASSAGSGSSELAALALRLGSDVPFLLYGGAALATGRGEVLEKLPSLQDCWLVLASPFFEIQRKTARLYGALSLDDFSAGDAVKRTASALMRGALPAPGDLHNAFSRPLLEMEPSIAQLIAHFHAAGAPFVALSGAGPTHYTIVPSLSEAVSLSRALASNPPISVRVLVARPVRSGIQRRSHKTLDAAAALEEMTPASLHAGAPASRRPKDPMTS